MERESKKRDAKIDQGDAERIKEKEEGFQKSKGVERERKKWTSKDQGDAERIREKRGALKRSRDQGEKENRIPKVQGDAEIKGSERKRMAGALRIKRMQKKEGP